MVVTGTRTRRSIKDNPANVTVITREQIESSPAKNVGDLLPYEPGIIVKRPVGIGEGVPTDICMRGVPGATAASRTLILIDGIPTNAAGTPFLIMNEVPMDAIDRVEIVRGPYSNLYGANAFGGVVNIITKNPGQGIHGGVDGAGYLNYYDLGGNLNGGIGRFSFLADAATRGIVNYYLSDSIFHHYGNLSRMSNADNYGYYEKRFFGKFNYAFSGNATLTLNARYFDSNLGFGESEYGHPPAPITTQGQKYLIGPSLKINLTPAIDLKVGGYFRHLTGKFYDWGVDTIRGIVTVKDTSTGLFDTLKHDTVGTVWTSSSNDWQVEAQSSFKFGNDNTLTAGFDLLDNSIDFGPRVSTKTGELLLNAFGANKAMLNGGLYVQDEQKLWKQLIAIAGLRVDYNSIFGFVPCPRVGFVYTPINLLRLRISAGRAFRAPSLGELYMPDMPVSSSATIVSNPDLKPEYIWSVDGGPEMDIGKLLTLRISPFYNSMDQLITQKIINEYYQDILMNETKLSHRNIQKAWSAGLENALEVHLANWGTLFFNYTYTKSEDEELKSRLEYIPDHNFNTGIYFKKAFGPVTLSGSILENYVGTRYYVAWQVDSTTIKYLPPTPSDFIPPVDSLASYFRTDAALKISYNDFVWIGIDGMNIFGATIEETVGTFSPKRFISVRAGIKF
ncbi:MAG TPA: TonB-dependent receptor [Chitinivibrionales bacterium]|nr:TonB-dependent receptor [Chitinivibrionales bacterium]